MKRLILLAALAGFVLPSASADAQILRRLRQRAEDAAGRVIDRAADRAVRSVEGRAAEQAGSVADSALARGANAAGLPALGGGGSNSGRTVDFRVLRDMLPSSFAGYRRGEATGQRSAAMGMETAEASASYAAGDASATLTITDMGTMRSWGAVGMAWMQGANVDRESDDGFERTLRVQDFPAHVTQSGRGSDVRAEMTAIVGERFMVKATVNGGDARVAQAAVTAVDLARLAEMAGPRIPPTDPAELRALLPTSVGSHARSGVEASTTTALGFSTSQAEATYGSGDNAVQVTILDYLDAAYLTAFAWMATTYDRQTDTGFERAARFRSFPSFESEERVDGITSSKMQVVVGQRFMVTVEGRVAFRDAKAAMEQIDLDALARRAGAR
ncbi:MAG: hypothetical protein IAE99_09190 [Rhodothermales bacterium]|nr:hypothetical protein [Rhodothermales bacterium]